ncbi:unnamed protein product [Closterium sp. Naga37s-1]|nr:unnamed protein product [Closterium sp. Naga37s-1]
MGRWGGMHMGGERCIFPSLRSPPPPPSSPDVPTVHNPLLPPPSSLPPPHQVLPPDMMLLADPNPPDIVEAITQAIQIVPRVNPQAMHERVPAPTPCHGLCAPVLPAALCAAPLCRTHAPLPAVPHPAALHHAHLLVAPHHYYPRVGTGGGQVSRMYSWHDMVERTERVYDRVMAMPLDDLPTRLSRCAHPPLQVRPPASPGAPTRLSRCAHPPLQVRPPASPGAPTRLSRCAHGTAAPSSALTPLAGLLSLESAPQPLPELCLARRVPISHSLHSPIRLTGFRMTERDFHAALTSCCPSHRAAVPCCAHARQVLRVWGGGGQGVLPRHAAQLAARCHPRPPAVLTPIIPLYAMRPPHTTAWRRAGGAAHGGGARLPPHAHRTPATAATTLLACAPSMIRVPRLHAAAGDASHLVSWALLRQPGCSTLSTRTCLGVDGGWVAAPYPLKCLRCEKDTQATALSHASGRPKQPCAHMGCRAGVHCIGEGQCTSALIALPSVFPLPRSIFCGDCGGAASASAAETSKPKALEHERRSQQLRYTGTPASSLTQLPYVSAAGDHLMHLDCSRPAPIHPTYSSYAASL